MKNGIQQIQARCVILNLLIFIVYWNVFSASIPELLFIVAIWLLGFGNALAFKKDKNNALPEHHTAPA